MRGPRGLPVWALLALATWLHPAVARSRGRGAIVVVVTDRGDDPLARRLGAELRSLGFDTVFTACKCPDGRKPAAFELQGIARRTGAVAAISIVSAPEPEPGGPVVPVVWIMDRVTGKVLARRVEVARGDASNRNIALRAVELLRASLLELRASHEVRGEVEAPPAAATLARRGIRRDTPRFGLDLGGALSLAPGGLSAMGHVQLGAGWFARPWLRIEAVAQVPVVPGRIAAAEGEAELYVGLAGLGGRFLFAGPGAPFQPSVGGGVAAVIMQLRGHAADRFTGHTQWHASVAPYLRGGLSVRLGAGLRLGTEVLLGVSTSQLVVDFAGREVASWGRPFICIALGLEVSLP